MDIGESGLLDRTAHRRARLDALLAEFAGRKRPVRVVRKRDHWHQRAADIALRIVTLNGQDRYLTQYVTTLGHTIYLPDDWDTRDPGTRWEVLRHEAVHVAQFERLGWAGMLVIYGLVVFPIGLAYGRARLEMEAYAETLRAIAELDGIAAAHDPRLHDEIVRRFTGPDYAWMWPFPKAVRRWIARALADIEGGSAEVR